ncbi:extracellular solute-binding protein [Streptomyces sp. SAJ15]|uniref:extracellular solute-binding protein n=1 Tax=Streptomyces sp. SAJ15 TaxID=2011095 RepID=UPI0011869C81|nr:extracellular solute-binding protein [Streptomyces sp. SAJ15]TVL91021.1 hypothetical protein CD790_17050 [Streptomyces sp. SAJ15]
MTMRLWVRTVLAACLIAGTTLTAGGCSRTTEELVVLGPWTDGEEKPFENALTELGERAGRAYVYKGTRSLRETLLAQLQAGAPPDVVIFSSPGDIAEYARAGKVRQLDEDLASRARQPWAPDVAGRDQNGDSRDGTYWVPVRVDLKSLVWSRTKPSGKAGTPADWCLGMSSGATSGWPGTDWVEDLVLQRQGWTAYERWATGETSWQATRPAWEEWADLLTAQGGDLGREGLATSFEQLGHGRSGLLNRGDCRQEHQGSFIRRHYDDDVRPYRTRHYLRAPENREEREAAADDVFEVSGDMAAVFTSDPAARELLKGLTSQRFREAWARDAEPGERPLFPEGESAPAAARPSAATGAVQELFDGARRVCLDASDAMPPTLREAFHRAVLEFLGAPKDAKLLTRLLDRLEAERTLQEREKAFVLEDLCARNGRHGA